MVWVWSLVSAAYLECVAVGRRSQKVFVQYLKQKVLVSLDPKGFRIFRIQKVPYLSFLPAILLHFLPARLSSTFLA